MAAVVGTVGFRNRHFFGLDLFLMVGSVVISFVIRFENVSLDSKALSGILIYLSFALPLRLIVFLRYDMYNRYWINAGSNELLVIAKACFVSSLMIILFAFGASLLQPKLDGFLPRSVPYIDALLVTILVASNRFSLRAYQQWRRQNAKTQRGNNHHVAQRILIIGAGQTGVQALDSLQSKTNDIEVVGFLDDDSNKQNTYLRGIKVLGGTNELRTIATHQNIQLVIIAIPSASGSFVRRVASICNEAKISYKIVPSLYEVISGKIHVNRIRAVSIEDLLGRRPVKLEMADVQNQLQGRCVMITGAGGSIGSELVRQIAVCQPRLLLLVGHGENSLFSIENQLKAEFPDVPQRVIVADVRDFKRLTVIFETWNPEIVFHAAAHKHVPLMETNIIEAVTNNVVSTRNLIALCNQFGVQRMIMLSTDKAVNPTSVMGMSKRIAEIAIISAAHAYPERFAAVRFGNVLGSRGSVVPTFQYQIDAGGPVTITSEAITRFFMSIPEAALLVLKASVLTTCGPLFVLNMGKPVRILDLACDLIRLSGLTPHQDVEIRIVGLRPGDKLYEELFWKYEKYHSVENGAIFAVQPPVERAFVLEARQKIDALIEAAKAFDEEVVRRMMSEIVFSLPNMDDSEISRAS